MREELHAQCFDELDMADHHQLRERGLLLLRVRDEIRMTIASYQTLYESSIAFGMRKALMAEYKKTELEGKVKQLEAEREDLTKQVADLTQRCEDIATKEVERRAADEAKHSEDVEKLKGVNLQLKTNLESMPGAAEEVTSVCSREKEREKGRERRGRGSRYTHGGLRDTHTSYIEMAFFFSFFLLFLEAPPLVVTPSTESRVACCLLSRVACCLN